MLSFVEVLELHDVLLALELLEDVGFVSDDPYFFFVQLPLVDDLESTHLGVCRLRLPVEGRTSLVQPTFLLGLYGQHDSILASSEETVQTEHVREQDSLVLKHHVGFPLLFKLLLEILEGSAVFDQFFLFHPSPPLFNILVLDHPLGFTNHEALQVLDVKFVPILQMGEYKFLKVDSNGRGGFAF